MSLMNSVERIVRFLGKDTVPPQAKRQLWYWYMGAKRCAITRSFDLPAIVLLEVNTDCNRSCSYCSNSVFPKPRQLMERDIFRKAIDDLAEVDYRGRISPHQSSEPLLHPDLAEIMDYADEKLPKAELAIYTNGDFLNRERFDQLNDAGVDTWIITQHGGNIPKPLQELLDSLSPGEKKRVTFQTIWQNKLFNRTVPGIIPENQRAIQDPCFNASFHLQVLVDGSVPQCCMGFAGENIFGNVKDRNLLDIWMDPEFRSHRHEVGYRRFTLDVCKRCVGDKPTATPIQFFEGYNFSNENPSITIRVYDLNLGCQNSENGELFLKEMR